MWGSRPRGGKGMYDGQASGREEGGMLMQRGAEEREAVRQGGRGKWRRLGQAERKQEGKVVSQ